MGKSKKLKGQVIFKPGQDIVASMADGFRKKLIGLMAKKKGDIVLDMADIDKVDTVGLWVMIATYNSLKKKGARLTLVNVPQNICNLLKTMRLNQHFEMH